MDTHHDNLYNLSDAILEYNLLNPFIAQLNELNSLDGIMQTLYDHIYPQFNEKDNTSSSEDEPSVEGRIFYNLTVEVGSNIATNYDSGKCQIISVSTPPDQQSLSTLPIESNFAYVRCGSELFFIDKTYNLCNKVDIDEHAIKNFDRKLKPSEVPKTLTKSELKKITSITGHIPVAINKIDENRRKYLQKLKDNNKKVILLEPVNLYSFFHAQKFIDLAVNIYENLPTTNMNDREKSNNEKMTQILDILRNTLEEVIFKMEMEKDTSWSMMLDSLSINQSKTDKKNIQDMLINFITWPLYATIKQTCDKRQSMTELTENKKSKKHKIELKLPSAINIWSSSKTTNSAPVTPTTSSSLTYTPRKYPASTPTTPTSSTSKSDTFFTGTPADAKTSKKESGKHGKLKK